jgi:hypothetical protein
MEDSIDSQVGRLWRRRRRVRRFPAYIIDVCMYMPFASARLALSECRARCTCV